MKKTTENFHFKYLLNKVYLVLSEYIEVHNKLFAGSVFIYLKPSFDFGEYKGFGKDLLNQLEEVKQQLNLSSKEDGIDEAVLRSFSAYLLALEKAIQKFTEIMSNCDSKSQGNNKNYSWLKHRKEYREYNKLCKLYASKGKILQDHIVELGDSNV